MENKQLYICGEKIHKIIQKHRKHRIESKIYETRKQNESFKTIKQLIINLF
jgi:hypothetical protein